MSKQVCIHHKRNKRCPICKPKNTKPEKYYRDYKSAAAGDRD